MNKNRSFLSILLALLLLFAQASSLAHTVVHGFETGRSPQEQQLPHEQTCDQCHACSEFGSALTGSLVFPIPLPGTDAPHVYLPGQAELPQSPSYFDSRAPPAA